MEVCVSNDTSTGFGEAAGGWDTAVPGASPKYRVDPDRRLVSVKFGKRLSESEIAAYAGSLRANPLFDPEFAEIVDLRAVEEFDLHGAHMMNLADRIDPFSHTSKRAFIVRSVEQSHSARLYRIVRCAKENFSSFHSVEEAEEWIGV